MSAYADQRGTVRLLVRGAVFRDRITHAYVLGQAAKSYRDGEMFTGVIKAAASAPLPRRCRPGSHPTALEDRFLPLSR
ncbi:hypothetical protein [Streptomyces pratensis]|uniref:hypothetical protein n=1 Tax=Streptomyces pratensis TaxID=1169025 RepID=UPI001933B9F0